MTDIQSPSVSRKARCASCQTVVASSDKLPFFEDRGEGSREAVEACRICKCFEKAHHPRTDGPASGIGKIPSVIGTPHPFEPHGAWEFDLYYCGCRGWD